MDQVALERAFSKRRPSLEFEIAGSVVDAKKKLNDKRYDAAVVDLNLGDGTCFDIFNSMNEIPFVVVTGAVSVDLAVEAMKCGAMDYIVKDMDGRYLDALPSVVASSIENFEGGRKPSTSKEALDKISAMEEAIGKFSLLLDQIENKNRALEREKRDLEQKIKDFKAIYAKHVLRGR